MKTASFWGEIGPVYDVVGVCELMHAEQALVDRLTEKHQLLALRTDSGRFIYPAFQFTASGAVIEGLGGVLHILAGAGLSSWTIASWFVSPDTALGGRTPIAALADGGSTDVLAVAELWATENS